MIVGLDSADDAAVVRLENGQLLVQTVDFFTPIVDDPYQFGQIAAANALSDIYAMGGRPLYALNIVAFPVKDLPTSILAAILQGGADKAREAGVSIVGGHSIDDKEPKYGLVVTGTVAEQEMVKIDTAHPGDQLVLTKPLGTGIITTAIKRELASEEAIARAVEMMSLLNARAAETMKKYTVHAATDVTGFGLLGHLLELCQASGVSARIDFEKLNFLPTAADLAEQDCVPGGSRRNLEYTSRYTRFDPRLSSAQRILTADAQTSGGLLITLPEGEARDFVREFNSTSPVPAGVIGSLHKQAADLISIS